MSDNFEKKTERVEVRVSHAKKQAFSDACHQQGDTPSNAIRRFINSYIRRADTDIMGAGLKAFLRAPAHYWKPTSFALVSVAILGFSATHYFDKADTTDGPIVSAPNGPFPSIDYDLFAAYDKNANGVLDLGEITDNDEHLHRVLNLDGKAGIAPAEFYTTGRMSWTYIKDKTLETGTNDNGPTAQYTPKGKSHLIIFDLSNPDTPKVLVTSPQPNTKTSKTETKANSRFYYKESTTVTEGFAPVNRGVGWVRGHSKPTLTFTDHDYRVRYTTN